MPFTCQQQKGKDEHRLCSIGAPSTQMQVEAFFYIVSSYVITKNALLCNSQLATDGRYLRRKEKRHDPE